MTEQTVSRTLVKSPPELWAEVSDPGALARHLGEFGEIRITRLEGESTVAWEGERASGTVELAPSGWGTRVTLTVHEPAEDEPEPEEPAAEAEAEAEAAPEPEPEAEPEPEPEAAPPPRPRLFARLFRRRRAQVAEVVEAVTEPEPAPEPEPEVAAPEPEPEPEPEAPTAAVAALTGALDSLGSAHHRPFSRG